MKNMAIGKHLLILTSITDLILPKQYCHRENQSLENLDF